MNYNNTKDELFEHICAIEKLLDKKYELIKKLTGELETMREQVRYLESQIYGGSSK